MGRKTRLRTRLAEAAGLREQYLTETRDLNERLSARMRLCSPQSKPLAHTLITQGALDALVDQLVDLDLIDRARYNHDRLVLIHDKLDAAGIPK